MSANITINKEGTAETFHVGKTPWHGLGQKLDNPATAVEAIAAAHMDWEVESKPVYMPGANQGEMVAIPNKQAIVRTDTQEVFNVFSRSYAPLQNRDAFGFFDKVVGEGQAIYHTAGSLGGGRKIWILAQLPGNLTIAGTNDEIERYILLSNSHDGTLAVSMKWTTVRVVCENTLMCALGGKGTHFRTEHQGNIQNRVLEAREVLELSDTHFSFMMEKLNQLAATKMNQESLDMFLWDLYELDPELPLTDQFHLKQLNYQQTMELFETGRGNQDKGVRGTAWAALNAVTEFVDYYRPVGSSQKSLGDPNYQDKRLQASWFGPGEKVKQQALDKLLVLAN